MISDRWKAILDFLLSTLYSLFSYSPFFTVLSVPLLARHCGKVVFGGKDGRVMAHPEGFR